MTLDPTIRDDLHRRLNASLQVVAVVAGGDIHQAFRVDLDDGRRIFVKTSRTTPDGLFAAESEGLRWLGSFGALPVPGALAFRDHTPGQPGYLALDWHAPAGRGNRDHARRFGRGLAQLHSNPIARPGWHRDVFIGPLPQSNQDVASVDTTAAWTDFWIHRRLLPMARRAQADLGRAGMRLIESVAERCAPLLDEVAQLGPLHGDLWAGNALWTDAGGLLIDPAVYAGDPEVDLAMMALFGGFSAEVWSAYFDVRPRAIGFEARRDLYQLWPLLVHVALFGAGYTSQVQAAARRVLAAV